MSGWNFRKSLGLLGGLVRLTATKRGVSTSVGRGPLRVGRGADGRYRATVRVGPFWKTLPLGRSRAREGAWPAPEGAPLPGPGAWGPPQGAPLAGPRGGA
jgi:hypothetical protein